jgi:RHS repeat-associated protein
MTTSRETVLCHYRYDPLDQLTAHVQPNTPERLQFYCKSRLATEIQGAMRYSIIQHDDQLLAQQRSDQDAAPDTMLLATDQQRSVLETLNTGHPRQPVTYSPFGHRPVGSGLLSLLGFNGERPDPVTGCYLLGNGYRAFSPVLMRFNSPDSLSPFGKGGINAYAYCGADPVNRRDPSGHLWRFAFIDQVNAILPNPNSALTKKIVRTLEKKLKHIPDETYNELNNTGPAEFGKYVFKTAINHIDKKIKKYDPTKYDFHADIKLTGPTPDQLKETMINTNKRQRELKFLFEKYSKFYSNSFKSKTTKSTPSQNTPSLHNAISSANTNRPNVDQKIIRRNSI